MMSRDCKESAPSGWAIILHSAYTATHFSSLFTELFTVVPYNSIENKLLHLPFRARTPRMRSTAWRVCPIRLMGRGPADLISGLYGARQSAHQRDSAARRFFRVRWMLWFGALLRSHSIVLWIVLKFAEAQSLHQWRNVDTKAPAKAFL